MYTENPDIPDLAPTEESDKRDEAHAQFPAKRAFTRLEETRNGPDLSVGWLRIIHVMHCEATYVDDAEVRSS